jgi:hypothetical protein
MRRAGSLRLVGAARRYPLYVRPPLRPSRQLTSAGASTATPLGVAAHLVCSRLAPLSASGGERQVHTAVVLTVSRSAPAARGGAIVAAISRHAAPPPTALVSLRQASGQAAGRGASALRAPRARPAGRSSAVTRIRAPGLPRHGLLASHARAGALVGTQRRLCTGREPAPPPSVEPRRWSPAWMYKVVRDTAVHYYTGSKLLWADVKIAGSLFKRMVQGRTLTRREHSLFKRVLADIARLVPLSLFVIIPFMEVLLPVAIRIFPNLLPSTFEEKHQKQEKILNQLKACRDLMRRFDSPLISRRASSRCAGPAAHPPS